MGKIISLSGIDGAGKSTQVEYLEKYLKVKHKRVYATQDLFGYFLLKPIIKALRSATSSPSEGPVKKNTGNLAKIWFIPAFIDIWVGYIFHIKPMTKKYDYVIADRTYADIWANLLYYGYLPQWAFKPFIKLLPRQDLSFMFFVKPENGKLRSDDFPISYFNKQTRIYKSLAKIFECHIIDVNHDKKVIFGKIKKILQDENII